MMIPHVATVKESKLGKSGEDRERKRVKERKIGLRIIEIGFLI
jgi:hypothetical protein